MNNIWNAIRNTFTSISNIIVEPTIAILVMVCIFCSIYGFIIHDWNVTIAFLLLELLGFQLYEIIKLNGSGK